jgi:asparaginyl-tRNA synthetase
VGSISRCEVPRSSGGTDGVLIRLNLRLPGCNTDNGFMTAELEALNGLTHRHLLANNPAMVALIKIRAALLRSARRFFDENGVTEVTVPTIASLTGSCEDFSTLFPLEYFGKRAFLIQTSQLHLEPLVNALQSVYSINHSYRAEPRADDRHLTEFLLIEAEMANTDLPHLMDSIEALVRRMALDCADYLQADGASMLTALPGLKVERLLGLREPFGRISYDDAVDRIRRHGFAMEWGDDLNENRENVLLMDYPGPVFVTRYPSEIKFFNMKRDPVRPATVLCCDLLLPGCGEAVGAAVREYNASLLRLQLKASKMFEQMGADETAYDWYFESAERASIPHAGYGLGFERLVRWVCGLSSILQSIEYPRNSQHLAP